MILATVIAICCYFYYSQPSSLLVKEKGNVNGLGNKVRVMFQREKFWKFQLELAMKIYDEDIHPGKTYLEETQELDQNMSDIQKEIDEATEDIYTPAEKRAQLLRREADRIEKQEMNRSLSEMFEKERLERIRRLKMIIPIIRTKLAESEHNYMPIFLLICWLVFSVLVIISIFKHIQLSNRKFYDSKLQDVEKFLSKIEDSKNRK